jgi:hypothetical protein
MVIRSIRVPEALWEEAKAKADERQENISDVVRQALERYVRSHRLPRPKGGRDVLGFLAPRHGVDLVREGAAAWGCLHARARLVPLVGA